VLDGLAALPGGADRAAGSLVRAVADLARLWLKPVPGDSARYRAPAMAILTSAA
jgi:hypothetical protein